MRRRKLRIIKDGLHKNVPYTEIENYIFSSKVFNRLHSIHQNSFAYMVYPSAESSRFGHSIGVMHLASLIFSYSLLNAKRSVMEKFVEIGKKDILTILDKIISALNKKKPSLMRGVEGIEIDRIKKYLSLHEMGKLIINEKALQVFLLPYKIEKDKEGVQNYIALYMILQALRISALLHDVGHLPFSHTIEEALYNLIDYFESEIDKSSSNIKIKKGDVYRILSLYHKDEVKLHERVTIDMIDLILSEEIVTYLKRDKENNTLNEREYYTYLSILLVLKEIIIDIFRKKGHQYTVSKSLSEIISGDIDADRLDFVARDLKISGLSEGGGDIERIVKFYTLYEKGGDFCFVPSIRSLNNIEWFLENRYTLYRYIACHHKVLLYNHLLKKSVEVLMRRKAYTSIDKKIKTNNILQLISVLDPEKDRLSRMFAFSQLDDHWLISILREEYFNLLLKTSKKQEDKILEFFLSELFTGSKQLRSIWKRDYEFRRFVIDSFLRREKIFYDLDPILKKINKTQKSLKENENLTKKEILERTKDLKRLRKIIGDFRASIKNKERDRVYEGFIEILNNVNIKKIKGIKHYVKKFERVLQEEFNNYKIICAAEEADLVGIKGFKLYVGENKLSDFDKVSIVRNYLQRKSERMSQFYVYLPIDISLTKNTIDKIKDAFISHFIQYISDSLKN